LDATGVSNAVTVGEDLAMSNLQNWHGLAAARDTQDASGEVDTALPGIGDNDNAR